LLDEQDADVDEDDLFREREEGCDCEVPEFDVTGREDGGREMRWDYGEADDQNDLAIINPIL